ncbi:MAG: carbamate kinase [Terriglobia bacterium]
MTERPVPSSGGLARPYGRPSGRTAVIAIGGNSLVREGESGTIEEQLRNAEETCEGIANIVAAGYRVVVTHGNGPQVGDALLRSELASAQVPPLPLDFCGAETQGSVGYLLQQVLANVLRRRHLAHPVVTVVTQVVVAADDPAFQQPTKPIGPFYPRQEAERRARELGWAIVEDAGRGFRRVVPSPAPREIVELPAIQQCLASGSVVIAVGGGGIPVIRRPETSGEHLQGVEAVIDKDRASSLLATALAAQLFVISTSVDRVALNFRQPGERFLDSLTVEEAARFLAEGHFPPGSMGPKIEAALAFLNNGGQLVVITSPADLAEALAGKTGTRILSPHAARAVPPRRVAEAG